MNIAIAKRWYLVQTRPCSEAQAATHLERQGFEIYFPRYLKSRRHARRVETVAAPLFPRYMFVAIDMAVQRWRAVQSTIGVARLVCLGESPTEVPNSVIDDLKRGHDGRGFVQLPTARAFKLGEEIRVLDGVFSSYLGLFERMTDGQRVAILLDLLGRKVRVVLDADAIIAA